MAKRLGIFLLVIALFIPGVAFLMMNKVKDNVILFTITRNFDDNVVYYELNLKDDGTLNVSDPIHPYWIRNTEGGVKKELSAIQRKFAYGLRYSDKSKDACVFRLVSYKGKYFFLKKTNSGEYHVYTKIDDHFVIVTSMFLEVETDSDIFEFPKVTFVDINYKEIKSSKKGTERIYIQKEDY